MLCTLWLSVPVANHQLRKLKFENAQEESFISSPLLLLFLPHFFFCWAFTRKASFWWEKFVGKLFSSHRIRWKEVWVAVGSGTRFSCEFSGQLYMVFSLPFFCLLTESCSFWSGLKDLFLLHKLRTKLSLTVNDHTWDT